MKRLICLCAVGAAALSGCGPIDYLVTVTAKATRAVAEARTADAEKLAPYEYWSAVEYIHMAREKAAYADYQVAIDYGERAEKSALEARRLAGEKAQKGGTSPGLHGGSGADETPPDLAPQGAPPAPPKKNQGSQP